MPEQRICQYEPCSQPFTPKNGAQKFCSAECRDDCSAEIHKEERAAYMKAWKQTHKAPIVPQICQNPECGKEFVKTSKTCPQKYCSPHCRRTFLAHKESALAYAKAWREAHKEESSASQKEWYRENREKLQVQQHEYYLEHREEILARGAKYWLGHREEKQAYNHQYYEKHFEEISAYGVSYHADNREKRNKYSREYYVKNREKGRICGAAYYEEHREELLAQHHIYYEENCEKLRAKSAEYRKTHPEVAHAAHARRRARKAASPTNDLTAAQWKAIKEHYGNKCVYCGRKMRSLTQDHITPLSKGGAHTLHNVVPACARCNNKKRTGPPPIPVQPLLLTTT